jgi:hypothetical protein
MFSLSDSVEVSSSKPFEHTCDHGDHAMTCKDCNLLFQVREAAGLAVEMARTKIAVRSR